MYGIEAVAEKEGEKTANCSNRLQTPVTTDPWMLFLHALKAPATREKYIQRLTKFLDFLGYTGTKEEKVEHLPLARIHSICISLTVEERMSGEFIVYL